MYSKFLTSHKPPCQAKPSTHKSIILRVLSYAVPSRVIRRRAPASCWSSHRFVYACSNCHCFIYCTCSLHSHCTELGLCFLQERRIMESLRRKGSMCKQGVKHRGAFPPGKPWATMNLASTDLAYFQAVSTLNNQSIVMLERGDTRQALKTSGRAVRLVHRASHSIACLPCFVPTKSGMRGDCLFDERQDEKQNFPKRYEVDVLSDQDDISGVPVSTHHLQQHSFRTFYPVHIEATSLDFPSPSELDILAAIVVYNHGLANFCHASSLHRAADTKRYQDSALEVLALARSIFFFVR